MSEISPLETPVAWQPSGNPEVLLEARLFGRKWQLRVGDFPAEAMWTLLVEGEEVGELEDDDGLLVEPDGGAAARAHALPRSSTRTSRRWCSRTAPRRASSRTTRS